MIECKLERGRLSFNLDAVLEQLPPDELRRLSTHLACTDAVLEDVTAQLLDGWTEDGSHGYGGMALPEPYTPLDKARRELAKRAGDVAKQELEKMERALRREIQRSKQESEWAWAMYHAWPDDAIQRRPERKEDKP